MDVFVLQFRVAVRHDLGVTFAGACRKYPSTLGNIRSEHSHTKSKDCQVVVASPKGLRITLPPIIMVQ